MSKNITLISNICFEPYWRTYIKERFSDDVEINCFSYEEYRDNVRKNEDDDIIIVCLNFEELYPNLSNDISSEKLTYETIENDCINKCKELYACVSTRSNAQIIWFGFEDYYCLQSRNCGSVVFFEGLARKLNLLLSDMLRGVTFIDLGRLIATVGIKNAYDSKGKYRWNAPYSKKLISLMADEVYKQYLIAGGKSKKCLVLDCDNVLWGGILSEDGIEGIQIDNSGLGRAFGDFQRHLIDLYYRGVILAVCSKNDESDVLRVFREHSGMLLKEEHIACFKCNWDDKASNIGDIAKELNIGLASIVFVDDSVFEIEAVRALLPEVTAILYQRDTVYDDLSCFNLKRDMESKNVKERINTYKTNSLREELKRDAPSYEEYLSSLETVVDIHRTSESELARVSELTQRTNVCTNGVRCTLEQLKSRGTFADNELYTVCLSDKFSDLGVVGVIGIKNGLIDLFSLSCRALGRGVQEDMLKFAIERGVDRVCFMSTEKNQDIGALFELYGLKKEPNIYN